MSTDIYAVEHDALRWKMNTIANTLEDVLNERDQPKRVGFILMAFHFGEDAGRCNYISNTSREDVVRLLEEQLAYFKRGL